MATIKERLDWAQNNQDNPAAQTIIERYKSGLYNDELKKAGMKPIPVKPPEQKPQPAQQESPSMAQSFAQGFAKPLKRFGSAVADAPSDIIETGQGIIDAVKRGAETTTEARQQVESGEISPEAGTAKTVGSGFAGTGAGIIGEIFTGALKTLTAPEDEQKIKDIVTNVGQTISETDAAKATIDWWERQSPETQAYLEGTGGLTSLLLEVVGAGPAARVTRRAGQEGVERAARGGEMVQETGKRGLEITSEAAQRGRQAIDESLAERRTQKAQQTAQAEREAIQEMIAPGTNIREVRKAMDEGRLVRGEQTLLGGKQPDIIQVSEKIQNVSDTVQRRIPDAAKLDDAQLNTRMMREIETISENLEDSMSKVRVRDITTAETPIVRAAREYKTGEEFLQAFQRGELDVDTVQRIEDLYGVDVWDNPQALDDLLKRSQNENMIGIAKNNWEALKKRQQNSDIFDEAPGAAKFQQTFENKLNSLTKGSDEKTLADLWNARKEYDRLIPDRIKQANDNSPISSQIKKEMWLENRRILNDLINDAKRGLGRESQEAFSDMSDLYAARQNITAKAKLDTKGEPGVIGKGKDWLFNRVLPFGLGGAVLP